MYQQKFTCGQSVLCKDGQKDVCDLEIGDIVITPIGYGNIGDSVVDRIVDHSNNPESLVSIFTQSGSQLTITNGSVVSMSIPNVSFNTTYLDPHTFYVYLMYKHNYGYRIGTTRNPRNRINGEHADKMWLIGVYDTVTEALYHENLLSFTYGIPTITFVDHVSRDKRREVARMTQPWIDKLFSALDTEKAVKNLCDESGFIISDLPHVVPQNSESRVSVYIDYFSIPKREDRGGKPYHSVSVCTEDNESILALKENIGIAATKSKRSGSRFRKTHKDAKEIFRNGLIMNSVLNGSIRIKTRVLGSKETDNSYSLQPYGCHAANILKTFIGQILLNSRVVMDPIDHIKRTMQSEPIRTRSISVVESPMIFINGILTFCDLR